MPVKEIAIPPEVRFAILSLSLDGVEFETVVAQITALAASGTVTGLATDLTVAQVRTLAETTLAQFERGMIKEVAQELDPQVKFIYGGPIDSATRDFCLDTISDQRNTDGFTEAEIAGLDNGQLPNVFLTGGGYNCRHDWRPFFG